MTTSNSRFGVGGGKTATVGTKKHCRDVIVPIIQIGATDNRKFFINKCSISTSI